MQRYVRKYPNGDGKWITNWEPVCRTQINFRWDHTTSPNEDRRAQNSWIQSNFFLRCNVQSVNDHRSGCNYGSTSEYQDGRNYPWYSDDHTCGFAHWGIHWHAGQMQPPGQDYIILVADGWHFWTARKNFAATICGNKKNDIMIVYMIIIGMPLNMTIFVIPTCDLELYWWQEVVVEAWDVAMVCSWAHKRRLFSFQFPR